MYTQAIESFKILGPIYIGIIWAAIIFLLIKWPGNRSMTISSHASASQKAYVFLAIVRTLAMPLFALFMYGWFIPTLQLPVIATICITLAFIGDFISAWIPDVTGRKGKIHKLAAYGMAAAILPVMLCVVVVPHISTFARILTYIDIGFMGFFWWSFLSGKKSKESYLVFQVGYILLFDIALLAASFT